MKKNVWITLIVIIGVIIAIWIATNIHYIPINDKQKIIAIDYPLGFFQEQEASLSSSSEGDQCESIFNFDPTCNPTYNLDCCPEVTINDCSTFIQNCCAQNGNSPICLTPEAIRDFCNRFNNVCGEIPAPAPTLSWWTQCKFGYGDLNYPISTPNPGNPGSLPPGPKGFWFCYGSGF